MTVNEAFIGSKFVRATGATGTCSTHMPTEHETNAATALAAAADTALDPVERDRLLHAAAVHAGLAQAEATRDQTALLAYLDRRDRDGFGTPIAHRSRRGRR